MKKVADRIYGVTIGYRFIGEDGSQLFYCNHDEDRPYDARWNLYEGDNVLTGLIETYPTLKAAFYAAKKSTEMEG